MTITLRSVKGSALTHGELDGNFSDLNARPSTDAEIKTAYENNADTNAYTDAEKTKVAGIEAGATADQTGAEIKTAYEGEANTNAFTDAEQTKVAAALTSIADDSVTSAKLSNNLLGAAAETDLTIAGGSITPTTAATRVDTEAAAATDDLANIALTNFPAGTYLLLRSVTGARAVTVKHLAGGAGEISLTDGVDFTFNHSSQVLLLRAFSTSWAEVARFQGSGRVLLQSVTGALDARHIGRRLSTSGSITIPTSITGWWAEIVVGSAAHDWTFNATTLDISAAGWSAGDEVHVVVTSASTLRYKRTPVANVGTEGDFA